MKKLVDKNKKIMVKMSTIIIKVNFNKLVVLFYNFINHASTLDCFLLRL